MAETPPSRLSDAALRLLADECCDVVLISALKAAGHDVTRVTGSASGSPDREVAGLASAEGRIILTYDYDFGELAVRAGTAVPGVILVACQSLPPAERAERVVAAVSAMGERLEGHLTLIERQKVRQRRLAAKAD